METYILIGLCVYFIIVTLLYIRLYNNKIREYNQSIIKEIRLAQQSTEGVISDQNASSNDELLKVIESFKEDQNKVILGIKDLIADNIKSSFTEKLNRYFEFSSDKNEVLFKKEIYEDTFNSFRNYVDKLNPMNDSDYNINFQDYSDYLESYLKIINDTKRILDTFEEFYYGFKKIILGSDLIRSHEDILVLPAIESCFKEAISSDFKNLPPIVLQRKAADIDLFLDERKLGDTDSSNSISNSISLSKNHLGNVILIIKILQEFRKKSYHFISTLLEGKDFLTYQLTNHLNDDLYYILFDPELSNEEKKLKIEGMIQESSINVARDSKEIRRFYNYVNKLSMAYYSYIKNNFIRCYNDLYNASIGIARHSENGDSDWTSVKLWVELYNDLMGYLEAYLNKNLSIFRIETQVGDIFNLELHESKLEAVKDERFENDQIAEILAIGFKHSINEEENYIIQPTNVLVVNNT